MTAISLTGVGTPTGMFSTYSSIAPNNSIFYGQLKATLGVGSALDEEEENVRQNPNKPRFTPKKTKSPVVEVKTEEPAPVFHVIRKPK